MGRGMKDILNELEPGEASPGEMLRAFRKRDGFTLEEMEEITGVKVPNLSAIENDKILMTQHYAEMFAAALKVHPSVFLYPNGEFAKDEKLLEIEKRAQLILKRHG
jgi:transcriptional regulator with XRE-family HTH domain